MIIILIFSHNLIIQEKNSPFNGHNNNNMNNLPYLSTIDNVAFGWNRTWDGSNADYGYGVALDSLNNIYIVGDIWNSGTGSYDMVLVKYDSFGVYQWNRTWGGADDDEGFGVAIDSSDNIYLTGATNSYGTEGSLDILLVKYDNSGIYQWNRTWGGNNTDVSFEISIDSSDNIYLVGYIWSFVTGSYDIVLVKYDSSGVYLWNRTWGGSNADCGYGVALDSSNNIYLAGYMWSSVTGSYDIVLVKYDSYGVYQWNRTWGGNNFDEGLGIAIDSLNNIYITGGTESFSMGGYDIVLVKWNSSGVLQWNYTWGGADYDEGFGVAIDSLDNIFLIGSTSKGEGDRDVVLVKYNNGGIPQWNHTWGGINDEEGSGIAIDSLNNLYITGTTERFGSGNYDIFLLRYNKLGKEQPAILIEMIILISIITGGAVIGLASVLLIRRKRIK
ncbi:MAG: SBBP repeat-containing protein [Promethearchaeota archaeon]